MRFLVSIVLAPIAFGAVSIEAFAQRGYAPLARGQELLKQHCSSCHQIGRGGASPRADAPPFHEVMKRYNAEALEEALAEGLATGHPDMPEFSFEPPEIAAIVHYLSRLRGNR